MKARPRLSTPAVLAALALAILVVWGPLFWAPFIYDDGLYLLNKPEITGRWPGVKVWLSTPMGGSGVYEPLNLLVHRWLWALAGDRPAPFRLASLALHWADAALVFLLLRGLLADAPAAAAGALLFAVFPAHAETLAVSTFKKHLLVSLFGLLMLVFARPNARRPWAPWAGAALLLLGLMTKESALAIPLLALLLSAAEGPGLRRRLRAESAFWLALAAAATAFLAWRLLVLPAAPRPPAGGSWARHLLTSAECLLWYCRLALAPWPLSPERDLPAVAAAFSLRGLAAGAGAAALAGAVAWTWRRDRLAAVGLAWFCVALSPFLNLVPSLNLSLVADRYLYLASAGGLLAACRWSAPWSPRARAAAAAALALGWSALALRQAALYASPLDLWAWAASRAPGNPRSHTAYGAALMAAGRLDDAAAEFERAVALSPDEYLPTSQMLLADVFAELGRLDEAIALSGAAAARNPTTLALSELGVLKLRAGDRAGAEKALARSLELNGRNGDALLALGQVRSEQGRAAEAERLWTEASTLYPFRGRALTELGRQLERQGRPKRAGRAFAAALEADPFELGARRGLASLAAADGRRAEGVRAYDELLARLDARLAALGSDGAAASVRAGLERTAADVRRERDAYAAGRQVP